jgi:hypothetical protein
MAALTVFEAGKSAYNPKFNQRSFIFSHNLAGNPLFERPRLVELAKRGLAERGPSSLHWMTSEAPVEAKWNIPAFTQKEKVTEAIANLETAKSWVLLYSVQRDPAYRALLDTVMREIEIVTELQCSEITWQDAYIFMASPYSVTPYHIDHEATFLFQMYGDRLANIWNANDGSVLTDPEIESYYVGDLGAATYKPENQSKADVYELSPGKGVHHPVRAPHWFKNGDTCSVALGVHFCMRKYDHQAKVYQVNHFLRRYGLNPTPPGKSAWRDRVKTSTLSVLSKRNPQTKNELLRSGINRMSRPLNLMQKLKRKR